VTVGALVFIATPIMHAQTAAWTATDKSDPLHQTSFKEFSHEGRFLVQPRQSNLSAPSWCSIANWGDTIIDRGTKSYSIGHFRTRFPEKAAAVTSGEIAVLCRVRDDDLRPGLRSCPVGDYVIIYRIDGEDVVILRVLRGSRNIAALFG
jgi:hypothetical protein